MKKQIATLLVLAALVVAPKAQAVTVDCSATGQYGGSVCGVTTTEETVTEHKYDTGIADWQLWQVVAAIGAVAFVSTVLYRATYKLYILG